MPNWLPDIDTPWLTLLCYFSMAAGKPSLSGASPLPSLVICLPPMLGCLLVIWTSVKVVCLLPCGVIRLPLPNSRKIDRVRESACLIAGEFSFLPSKLSRIIKKSLSDKKAALVTSVFIMLVHTLSTAVLMVVCPGAGCFGPALSCHTVCSAQRSGARTSSITRGREWGN